MTKRVGLAAPHPAAHKCAIVPFRLPKRLFAYVFAESLHDFAKQGHKRPGMRTAARFFGILLGRCFTQWWKWNTISCGRFDHLICKRSLKISLLCRFYLSLPASGAPELDKIMILAYLDADEQKSDTFCTKSRLQAWSRLIFPCYF